MIYIGMTKCCAKCGEEFKNFIIIDGKRVNLQRRLYCLKCSPYKGGNRIKLDEKNGQCIICNTQLINNQKIFCSAECKGKSNSKNTYKCQQKRAFNRKKELILLKGGKCSCCGYDKNLAALELHHIDPFKKTVSLDGRTMSSTKMSIILNELDKCLVFCANCHREHHHKIFNDWKY